MTYLPHAQKSESLEVLSYRIRFTSSGRRRQRRPEEEEEEEEEKEEKEEKKEKKKNTKTTAFYNQDRVKCATYPHKLCRLHRNLVYTCTCRSVGKLCSRHTPCDRCGYPVHSPLLITHKSSEPVRRENHSLTTRNQTDNPCVTPCNKADGT